MAGFTGEEKREFRFKKYVREHIPDFFIHLALHTALTELIVFLCGGSLYGRGFALALGYTAGKWVYEMRAFKKDWLEAGVKESR